MALLPPSGNTCWRNFREYFPRQIYPEYSCSCYSYWWVHYWDSHGAQCSPLCYWWWPCLIWHVIIILMGVLSIKMSLVQVSPIMSIFSASLSLRPHWFTIVTSFMIFVAWSLTVYSFPAPVHYSFRPIQMLRGLVFPGIVVHFLFTVFFWWFSHCL